MSTFDSSRAELQRRLNDTADVPTIVEQFRALGRPDPDWLFEGIKVPTLIITGDEDDPCLEPGLLMKRHIPTAGLVVLPWSGHTINIEEPEPFNRALLEFFLRVDEGRAGSRDPRSLSTGILGYAKK